MPKKDSGFPWMKLLLWGGGAAAVYALWPSSASAATTSVSAGGQKYMTQIMALQTAFQAGQMSQAQYTASATGLLTAASIDPTVSAADLKTLHAVGVV
jgi:hypothetical protein